MAAIPSGFAAWVLDPATTEADLLGAAPPRAAAAHAQDEFAAFATWVLHPGTTAGEVFATLLPDQTFAGLDDGAPPAPPAPEPPAQGSVVLRLKDAWGLEGCHLWAECTAQGVHTWMGPRPA